VPSSRTVIFAYKSLKLSDVGIISHSYFQFSCFVKFVSSATKMSKSQYISHFIVSVWFCCNCINKNKYISFIVMSLSSVSEFWWYYLLVSCASSCIIPWKESMKTWSWIEPVVICGASSSHYPLGLLVNLWMTIAAFEQCMLLVYYTHVSSVLFFVSFWMRNVFLLRWLHISISSCAMACFPRDWKPFLCVAFRIMNMNCASSPAL